MVTHHVLLDHELANELDRSKPHLVANARVNAVFTNDDVFLLHDFHGETVGSHIVLIPTGKVDTRGKHTNSVVNMKETPIIAIAPAPSPS